MKQKSENQKALPKFLGILVIASLVGGVLGGLSGAAGYFLKGEELGAAITRLLSTASPWAMPYAPPCCWAADSTSIAVPEPPSVAGTVRTRM